jgi:hypothetical protein
MWTRLDKEERETEERQKRNREKEKDDNNNLQMLVSANGNPPYCLPKHPPLMYISAYPIRITCRKFEYLVMYRAVCIRFPQP